MLRFILASCVAITAWPALAQRNAAIGSPACHAALAALQAKESSVLAAGGARGAALPQLDSLRRSAASACLGGRADAAAAAQRFAQPPISVGRQPVPAPRRPGTPTPSPIEPLPSLTNCDSAGCWASDGTRLNRIGPALLGPRGICRVAGVTVQCP